MSCGVGCRRGLDPALLWLWRRLAAIAPIQPLAWEPPCAVGAALEKAKSKKKKSFSFTDVQKQPTGHSLVTPSLEVFSLAKRTRFS